MVSKDVLKHANGTLEKGIAEELMLIHDTAFAHDKMLDMSCFGEPVRGPRKGLLRYVDDSKRRSPIFSFCTKSLVRWCSDTDRRKVVVAVVE